MYESISYLEINCSYNQTDLRLYASIHSDVEPRRGFTYRNRSYILEYVPIKNEFYISNRYGVIFAVLRPTKFCYDVTAAPELGLNLIWGLLAKLNIYPVKCS